MFPAQSQYLLANNIEASVRRHLTVRGKSVTDCSVVCDEGLSARACLPQLPGGDRIKTRNSVAIDQQVFAREGAVKGTASSLTLEIIEI